MRHIQHIHYPEVCNSWYHPPRSLKVIGDYVVL